MDDKYYKKLLKDELIVYRNLLNLDKNITFGIEIEYENILTDLMGLTLLEDDYIDLKRWKNKSELDIFEYNKYGDEMNGEVISPILHDSVETWKKLEKVLNLLESKGAKITEKCGGHVNIGTNILENNPLYYRNLLLLWKLYSKYIHSFASGEYNCLRNNDKVKILNFNTKYLKEIESFVDLAPVLYDKEHEIYIDDKKIKGRIEFRIPNGTLSKELWQNNVNFFTKLLIACKKELDVEKIVYKINNNDSSATELANYIFDDEFDKEQFLIQTLKTNKIYKREPLNHIVYR